MVKRVSAVLLLVVVDILHGILLDTEYSGNGESPAFWRAQAKTTLLRKIKETRNENVAKNVILFLGDGMSMPTITASRILKGQLQGRTGEETVLSWDKFPITGLSKTYCQNKQVTDSGASATAYLCGVKANYGTMGVDARVTFGNCFSQQGAEVTSILDWSLAEGKSVGLVTVTHVTDASPAGLYAHVADRWWEGDRKTQGIPGGCKDIASQLIDDNFKIQVILGGGRRFFMRDDQNDPEHGSNVDVGRQDSRDLIQEWKNLQHQLGRNYNYVWNATNFHNVNPYTTDSLLGLFESSHMNWELERNNPLYDKAGEPSLAEMTEKAIKILSKNPKGYFLFVEGGNIDKAHHYGRAKVALHETLAFQDAVGMGDALTSANDTLLVVTADHSHTVSMAGYPSRGNPILGKVDDGNGQDFLAADGRPYTTLLYGDGPGHHGYRPDISHVDTTDAHYLQQAGVPMDIETHGGDDVAIYARGPQAHLLSGTHEQNDIAHVMAYASCVGDYTSPDDCPAGRLTNNK